MTDVKKNERFVPIKNYIITILMFVLVIGLTLYIFSWSKVVQENKISTSYLIKEKIISKEIKDLNEVSDVFKEAPKSYFVLISYTGDKDVYNMEKGLKNTINDYNLNDSFYYLNVTSIKDDKDYINKVNNALKLDDMKVTNVPTIIYYNEGKVEYIITKKDKSLMNVNDLQKLLDVSGIQK